MTKEIKYNVKKIEITVILNFQKNQWFQDEFLGIPLNGNRGVEFYIC